ncbi:NAD(P)/FAD-dependent oxidoreductase, partial [Acinetobacter baumannii]
YLLKKSIDARSKKQVWINLTVHAFINEPFIKRPIQTIDYDSVKNNAKRVVIIGAGPAGLFAALNCIEKGMKPIVLERGKDVRNRR